MGRGVVNENGQCRCTIMISHSSLREKLCLWGVFTCACSQCSVALVTAQMYCVPAALPVCCLLAVHRNPLYAVTTGCVRCAECACSQTAFIVITSGAADVAVVLITDI